jgi:TolB protein
MNKSLRSAWVVGVLTLMVLVPAGCSPALLRDQVNRLVVPQNTVQRGSPPEDPTNRILLQGTDGNLYIASPDGQERFALTDDASRRRIYGQPTWSPDASRVAWNLLTRRGTSLGSSRFDGSERMTLDVPYLPFYISWSPSGEQLAYLSNWQVVDEPSMALRVVDVASSGKTVKTVATGQPFYFSWAPEGERLLAHIDNERVEVYDVAADADAVESLVISGGEFSTPQWSSNGEQLVYAVADERMQQLLVTDVAGNPLQNVTDYDGRVSFSLSPDGSRLAYVATEADVEAPTLGALYIVDIDTLRTQEISAEPVIAFFWSPDSSKLAFLALDSVNRRIGMRWSVWDESGTQDYAAFFPTRELLQNFLPFFDQYAQSHRIWSPASDALVFAGTLANGQSGVWVQPIGGEEAPPVRLGDGVLATWSPR